MREDGCSLDEVAAQLGCTAMAALLCDHRARANILRHLGEASGVTG